MSAKNPERLYVAEMESPRLWLAPSKFSKSLFEPATSTVQKSQKDEAVHLYLKGKE